MPFATGWTLFLLSLYVEVMSSNRTGDSWGKMYDGQSWLWRWGHHANVTHTDMTMGRKWPREYAHKEERSLEANIVQVIREQPGGGFLQVRKKDLMGNRIWLVLCSRMEECCENVVLLIEHGHCAPELTMGIWYRSSTVSLSLGMMCKPLTNLVDI